MTLHKEVSLALSVPAYVRMQAYMPYLIKEGETKLDVHRFILELVKTGKLPAQANEFEFDSVIRKYIHLKVPSWTMLEVDAQGRPLLAKCVRCKTTEVSLVGHGNVNGAPVQGFLVSNGNKEYRCQECRKSLRRLPFVGFREAHEIARRHRAKQREKTTTAMSEKLSAVA